MGGVGYRWGYARFSAFCEISLRHEIVRRPSLDKKPVRNISFGKFVIA